MSDETIKTYMILNGCFSENTSATYFLPDSSVWWLHVSFNFKDTLSVTWLTITVCNRWLICSLPVCKIRTWLNWMDIIHSAWCKPSVINSCKVYKFSMPFLILFIFIQCFVQKHSDWNIRLFCILCMNTKYKMHLFACPEWQARIYILYDVNTT